MWLNSSCLQSLAGLINQKLITTIEASKKTRSSLWGICILMFGDWNRIRIAGIEISNLAQRSEYLNGKWAHCKSFVLSIFVVSLLIQQWFHSMGDICFVQPNCSFAATKRIPTMKKLEEELQDKYQLFLFCIWVHSLFDFLWKKFPIVPIFLFV